MFVKELLKQLRPEAILENIKAHYPEEQSRIESGYYQNLIDSMNEAFIMENAEHMTVHVEYAKDFGKTNPTYIWNASYSTHKRYNHKYSLKFVSLQEIASSFVYAKDLEMQEVGEYVARLLYEIAHRDIVDEDDFACVEKKESKEYCTVEEAFENSDVE